jgi:hypothetical protein
MDTFDWKSRIREWSRKRIELLTEREKAQLPLDILESGYLGHPGVTEEQIAVVEARLGLTFPPSYRDFLKVSNGLRSTSEDGIQFYPIEEIDWYALDYQEWINECIKIQLEPVTDEEYFIYDDKQCNENTFRPEYLQTALEISSEDMGFIFLLIPQVITPDGEWEAWFCSFSTTWGVYRYRSFGKMMEEILSYPEFLG